MNVYKQHYSKSDKSEKVAADMNVIDQRQHNKRKRIQRQRIFAKKRKKFIIISWIKKTILLSGV